MESSLHRPAATAVVGAKSLEPRSPVLKDMDRPSEALEMQWRKRRIKPLWGSKRWLSCGEDGTAYEQERSHLDFL